MRSKLTEVLCLILHQIEGKKCNVLSLIQRSKDFEWTVLYQATGKEETLSTTISEIANQHPEKLMRGLQEALMSEDLLVRETAKTVVQPSTVVGVGTVADGLTMALTRTDTDRRFGDEASLDDLFQPREG